MRTSLSQAFDCQAFKGIAVRELGRFVQAAAALPVVNASLVAEVTMLSSLCALLSALCSPSRPCNRTPPSHRRPLPLNGCVATVAYQVRGVVEASAAAVWTKQRVSPWLWTGPLFDAA